MTSRTTRLLLGLSVLAMATAGCRGMTSTEPPIHFQQNMDQQERFEAQEENTFFADGRAMRDYVDGTVAARRTNGQELDCLIPGEDVHRCTGKVNDSWAEELPMEVTTDLLERGRERYDIYCTPCHDSSGAGNGTVVARNAGMITPPSYHDDRIRAMAMGQFYDIIGNGVRNMPGYATQIPVDDRWAIAAYIRVLQYSQNASLSDVPSDVKTANGWE